MVQASKKGGLMVFDDFEMSTPVAKQPPLEFASRYRVGGGMGASAAMGKIDPPDDGGDAAAGGGGERWEKENIDPHTGLHARWRSQEAGSPGTPGNLRPLVSGLLFAHSQQSPGCMSRMPLGLCRRV